jgi:hypothetical protein
VDEAAADAALFDGAVACELTSRLRVQPGPPPAGSAEGVERREGVVVERHVVALEVKRFKGRAGVGEVFAALRQGALQADQALRSEVVGEVRMLVRHLLAQRAHARQRKGRGGARAVGVEVGVQGGFGAFVLGDEGAGGPFVAGDGGVGVEADCQGVALPAGKGQVLRVPGVKDVEAAVGEHELAARRAQALPLRPGLVAGQNLRCRHAHELRSSL